MKKRVLSMFMALALCLTLLPTAAFAEGEDVSISGGVIGGGETGGEGGGVLVPPGGSTGEGGGIYVAPGSPTEGGGGTYIPGEDTQTEIWCTSKPDFIGRGYDGTTDGSTIPINLTFTDGTNNIILKEGTGFTAKKTFDSADAGWHTVTVEIALIGEAAVKYKLKAGEETFTIGGNINKAYPKLTVSLSQTTCTAGEKLLPLLSVEGAPEDAEVTYYYLASALKSWAGSSDVEGGEAMPKIDENTAISEPGTYYVYAKTGETTNYEEERSTTVELTVNEAVVEAASVTRADGTDGGTYESLPAALNAAQDGDTVKLLANHVTDADALNALGEDFTFEQYASIVPVVTKTLTLDLNHKTVDYLEVGFSETNKETQEKETLATGNLTVTSEAAYGRILNLLFMAGALDIQSGEIGILVDDNGVESPDGGLVCDVNSGTATISNGMVYGLTVLEGAAVTVKNGFNHRGRWSVDSGGTLSITGGTFKDVQFVNSGTIAISGGTFEKISNNDTNTPQPLMLLLAKDCAFVNENNTSDVQDGTKTSLTGVMVKEHMHTFENGKCACGVKAIVTDNNVNYYNTLQAALDAAANNASITSVTLGQDLTEDVTFSGSAAGSLTLNMNGHKLETEAGVPLTVTGGTLRIEGAGEINQNTASNATAFPAISLTGGKLVITGDLTAQGGYDSSSGRKPAIYATDGELDLQGNVSLNGGLTITGTAKLTNPLTQGTFYVDASETGNAIAITDSEVPGGEVYKKALELLAKDYAFYRANGSLADAGGAKLSTGTYTIKSHTCSYTHNETYGIAYCNCGRSHAHRDLSDEKSVLVNGVCPICGYHCPHKNIGDDGVCTDCNAKMVAKVEVGDTVTYSADFKEAMKNAANGTKITLLADVSIPNRTGISGDNTTVTLDLNKHKITGGWLDVGGKDTNETYTACTLKIIGKGSYEPPMYGGIITVNMKATLDLSEWEGGTISSINISDSSDYEAETREAAVIVGPKAGTIGKLSFGNNQLDELKKTKLSGGSFNEIWVADFGPVKLGELLADGYAFQNGDGSYVEYGTTLRGESIFNVKVVKCLHPNMKPGEDGVATCEYCGKSGKFVASVDGNLYTDMNGAISYWLKNGGTLKLYGDYTATDGGTWSIGSGSHTVNLNGHRMSVQNDGAFKPTNNMHLTVTDDTERGQIENILLDGSQRGSFTLENGYVCNLEMTGGAVVALKGGSVDNLDVQNCSANTNLSIQGGSIGKLNIKDWADGMHVSATGGSLGAYKLPSGKILADVLDHQYYATGTSLDRQVDTAQPVEKFVIKQAPYDFGSTSKAADVPINGSIPFRVDSPSENVGVYEVKWYRRTNSGAEHMVENKVADVNVGDRLDVFCVITGVDKPNGAMQWQVAVKGYTINVVPAMLNDDRTVITQKPNTGNTGNPADNRLVVTPFSSNAFSDVEYQFEVTYNGQLLELGKDYTIKDSSNKAMNAGTHTLTIEGRGNYTGEKSVTWTLEPYELSVENFRHAHINKTYDGTDAVTDSTNGINALDGFIPDSENPRNPPTGDNLNLHTSDYQLSNMKFDSAEAGDRTFTGTMTLTPDGNFVFAGGSRVMQIEYGSSGLVSVSINRAIIAAPAAKALQVANNHAATYTVDLSALLPKLESPKKYGEVTYELGTDAISFTTAGYYDATKGNAEVKGDKLILPIQAVKTDTTGNIGSVKVKVSTTNYHDFTLTINVNATNKIVPTGEPTLSATTLTYGQALSAIKLSGKLHDNVNNKNVEGMFMWADGTVKPNAGSYEAAWKFTPADGDTYTEADGTVTITVNKAKPTGDPTCTKITTSGKTLADAPLAIGTIAPAGGTLAWDMAANTVVAANTAYGWTYTPADTANYKALTGSLTPYAVSSGGGGGSSAATPSVSDKAAKELKNAKEGSTVTIDMKGETKLPASVTKEIAGKDVTVELDMGGGMVWSFNGLDVPKGGVSLDLGVKTGTKTIPAKVINALTGEMTTIQLQLNHNGPFGMSLKLSVDLGKKHDGLYANLYFYNPKSSALEFRSAGMISGGKASWVFDHASDYAIVIDKESHESMTFTDVPDTAYYAEAVNWAVAKKITEGVGNKLFGSNDPCTRAQIVTFLWRAAGSPGPKTMSGFSDVPADSYYAKAVAWAVENGITGGTGDGKFSPDATCTRAQAVTFLYRASGAPAVSGNAAFSDVATNAYYAAAVKWAEKNGITGGIGGGLFGSDNNCTRAQIVTFLYRNYQSK